MSLIILTGQKGPPEKLECLDFGMFGYRSDFRREFAIFFYSNSESL